MHSSTVRFCIILMLISLTTILVAGLNGVNPLLSILLAFPTTAVAASIQWRIDFGHWNCFR